LPHDQIVALLARFEPGTFAASHSHYYGAVEVLPDSRRAQSSLWIYKWWGTGGGSGGEVLLPKIYSTNDYRLIFRLVGGEGIVELYNLADLSNPIETLRGIDDSPLPVGWAGFFVNDKDSLGRLDVTLDNFHVVGTVVPTVPPPPPPPTNWALVWSDEFDGTDIDLSKWSHEVNAWGGGNNELQYYTDRPTNSFIQDGCLVIQALDETYTGPEGTRDYTSARLRTLNKGDWTYGRLEARMKLPYGQGLWPAFWMLPSGNVYGGWAASGEIDIMELVGHEPNVIHGTIHYGGEWPNNASSGNSWTLPSGDFCDDFHVFALVWQEGVMRWYVDGIHYSTQTSWWTDEGSPFPAPFDQDFHILLNVAVGGNWPGPPDETTVFPQQMAVDKPLLVRSVNGPEFTLIEGWQVPGTTNGGGAIRWVYLTNDAVLSGFTLTHGATRTEGDYSQDERGGGVWCESPSAVLTIVCSRPTRRITKVAGRMGAR
jgi:beta-glucanase (GH16 family)